MDATEGETGHYHAVIGQLRQEDAPAWRDKRPEADTWLLRRYRDIASDPRRDGAPIITAWIRNWAPDDALPRRPRGGQAGAGPLRNWIIRMVGLLWLGGSDDVADAIHDPDRTWPMWAFEADAMVDGVPHHIRQIAQLWALRAAPADSPMWCELAWEPDSTPSEPQMGLFGWGSSTASGRQAHQVLDGGLALLKQVRRRGPRGLAEERLYTRLCAAQAAVTSQGLGGARQIDLAQELGRGERTVRRWIDRVKKAGYAFPPPARNIGR